MPAVSVDTKGYIAQRLARFATPSPVAASVKERFGLEITRQGIESYDPTKWAGRSRAADYAAAFTAERAAFLTDLPSIGIASKVVRLRNLQRLCNRAE